MNHRATVRCLVAAGLLAACLAQAQTWRWATQGDVQTLDPHAQNELLTNSINGQVYDSLVMRDKKLEIVPALATEGGIGYYNWGNVRNPRLDELAIASSKKADPVKREQLIKAALREHNEQVHHIPLHRQVIPWAARSNVNVVHRADNWLEWQWVTVGAR